MDKKLLVLSHSGGLDSSTLFLKALKEGYTVLPIVYKYGQANFIELEAQSRIHMIYKKTYPDQVLDTIFIDYTENIGDVISLFQKNRDNGKAEENTGMKYYMPSRNLLFMSTAAVIGEIIAADESIDSISLGLGIHKHSDIYERDYWDISPTFAEKLSELLSLNDTIKIDVYAPYQDEFKSKIIMDAIDMGVPYENTWTCYEPVISYDDQDNVIYTPCNECEACKERKSQAVESGHDSEINDYKIIVKKSDFSSLFATKD